MPEGHTIHRLAERHRDVFAGDAVRAWSPQGRFASGAAAIDGAVLVDTAAHGKHLFYDFGGDRFLHVHLGLIGTFRTFRHDPPEPTPTTRLALGNDSAAAYLTGPMTCRLVTHPEADEVLGGLGPDPLRDGMRGRVAFRANLRRRSLPIGSALLDQRIVAGIGNVYRAEILFLCGIDPRVPANAVTQDDADRLWETMVLQLRHGRRIGRIVTVEPAEVGARYRTTIPPEDRLYVYHRDGLPCRHCGAEIRRFDLGGRSIWFCPVEQVR